MNLLLLHDLLDRSASSFGIQQHSFVRGKHLLNTGDVSQLSGGTTIVEAAEMLIAGKTFAHFENLDVAVLQLPNLTFGQDQGSAFAIQFHISGLRVGDDRKS